MGFREKSNQLLSIFKWAPNFLTLNLNPLEAYASAINAQEVAKAEADFF
jgi:ribosome biogenesis protein Tsr3